MKIAKISVKSSRDQTHHSNTKTNSLHLPKLVGSIRRVFQLLVSNIARQLRKCVPHSVTAILTDDCAMHLVSMYGTNCCRRLSAAGPLRPIVSELCWIRGSEGHWWEMHSSFELQQWGSLNCTVYVFLFFFQRLLIVLH